MIHKISPNPSLPKRGTKRATEIFIIDPLDIVVFHKDKWNEENSKKLPAYKAGHQNNIINDNSICIPLFSKEGLGEIFKRNYS
ncbi:MAG TPA: hypothetical protein ENH24_02435 [Nitrospirae bacterium]|nr:hypothetical protein [Nitrospirota bacterium]